MDGPAFDREGMMAKLGGDAGLLSEVVSLFVEETPGMLADVREAVAGKDPSRVRFAAHALRGALLSVSAEPAAAVANRLEQLGAQGDLANAEQELSELEAELHRLTEELRSSPD